MPFRVMQKATADPAAEVLVSMENGYGAKARIVRENDCYVLQSWSEVEDDKFGEWRNTTHWFTEAIIALCRLVGDK